MNRKRIGIFVRWLILDTAKGGCALKPSQVSFGLVLNHKIIVKYVIWRTLRAAHLEVDGEPLGPLVASTERDLLAFFETLVHPETGWLAQSPHVVEERVAITDSVRIPRVRSNKDGLSFVDDETCKVSEIMPPAVVALDWKAACAASHAQLSALTGRYQKRFKLIRDGQNDVGPILRHAQPIAVILRMVREALKHARPIETAPSLHAKDYARAVVMLLLMTVVFRSKTMRGLTYRPDGTGNVSRTETGYDVVVEATNFKNGVSEFLFGPSWRRRDYERELKDWGGLTGVLDHYITKCRPILLNGRSSNLLIPPPKGREDWDESNFNYLVNTFTRSFCVYNKRYGTGMEGVRPFGPHPCRDIVATHIIKNYPGEDRWQIAAFVLSTGVEQIKLRYGWISSAEELAKSNPLLDDASRIAAGDTPLW